MFYTRKFVFVSTPNFEDKTSHNFCQMRYFWTKHHELVCLVIFSGVLNYLEIYVGKCRVNDLIRGD